MRIARPSLGSIHCCSFRSINFGAVEPEAPAPEGMLIVNNPQCFAPDHVPDFYEKTLYSLVGREEYVGWFPVDRPFSLTDMICGVRLYFEHH